MGKHEMGASCVSNTKSSGFCKQTESSEGPEILRAEAAQKGRWEKEDAPQRRRDHLIHGHREVLTQAH